MNDHRRIRYLVVTCLILFLLGLLTAALGPVLPELATKTQCSLAQIGYIFTAIFLGALLAQVVSGFLSDRFGAEKVILIGVFLLSIGTLGFCHTNVLSLILILAFMAGIGHGALDLGGNLLIARVFADRSVSALNLLNIFFGIGAFTGPGIVSAVWQWSGKGEYVLVGGAIILFLCAPLIFFLGTPHLVPLEEKKLKIHPISMRSPVLLALGLVILLYVGTENGIGGWIATYIQHTTEITKSESALVASGFWIALTVGRLAGAISGMRLRPMSLLLFSLIGSSLASICLVSVEGIAQVTISGVIVMGFSFGAIYPTVMAITVQRFQAISGRAVGFVSAMGSLGGMLLPVLQGFLMEEVSMFNSMRLPAVSVFAMLGLFGIAWYGTRRWDISRENFQGRCRGTCTEELARS